MRRRLRFFRSLRRNLIAVHARRHGTSRSGTENVSRPSCVRPWRWFRFRAPENRRRRWSSGYVKFEKEIYTEIDERYKATKLHCERHLLLRGFIRKMNSGHSRSQRSFGIYPLIGLPAYLAMRDACAHVRSRALSDFYTEITTGIF